MRFLALCTILLVLADQTLSGKFDYGLFENFVQTRVNFEQEVTFVPNLYNMLNVLKEKRDTLEEALVAKRDISVDSVQESWAEVLDKAEKTASGFGNVNDLTGALKGILMLLETYQMTFEDLVKGELKFPHLSLPEERLYPSSKLTVHDLVDLGGVALNHGWHNIAVPAVKLGVKMLKNYTMKYDWEKAHLDQLHEMKKILPKLHNDYLVKRKSIVGDGYKTLPYLVDENLNRRKKQPKYIKNLKANELYLESANSDVIVLETDVKENRFRQICRKKLVGQAVFMQQPLQKCHFLHHQDPFLKLGPFKMEVLLADPFRMIFRDIFTEKEMKWMLEYSKPRLSRARGKSEANKGLKKQNLDPTARRIVHKTVQVWIMDKQYDEETEYDEDPVTGHFIRKEFKTDDPEKGKVNFPLMRNLGWKIGLATGMAVNKRFSSTAHQVTNYGLGGLCETHIDPHGMIEGGQVHWEQRELFSTGDMIGTFMGWLEDVEAGGATAFDWPGYEQLVVPEKGSAAFWIDLDRKGYRDTRSSHGGCPVGIGSKWILNKWIYYYNQFKNYRCGLQSDGLFGPFSGVY